jgi:hypothetical protein
VQKSIPMQGIQFNPESVEQIRERLRKMSDLELRRFGQAARDLADPAKNLGNPNSAFAIQLREARAEPLIELHGPCPAVQ